jgi:hypothetical protein
MSAFVAGMNIVAAICCGLAWLKYREKLLAVIFWLNLVWVALNAYFWLT